MKKKVTVLATIFFASSKSLTLWKEVKTGSLEVGTLTLTGPNQQYITQGNEATFTVYQMD